MKPWIAELLKPVTLQVTFDSTDVQSGNTFESYTVPSTMTPGKRRFLTKQRAMAWVELMNRDHGPVARFIGKQ